MSNSDHIYTRSRIGIDTRVWMTLGIACFLSLGLLAYKIADNVKCVPFTIAIKGYTAGKANSYYVAEEISFSTTLKDGANIEWDFGDHQQGKGATVRHAFTAEGTFIVTATANGQCVESITLNIHQLSHPPTVSSAIDQNPVSGPELVHTGEAVNFTSATVAGSYEWTVLNAPDFPVQTADVATYTFPTPGTRIIELKLDGDPKKVFRKTIQVLQAVTTDNAMPDNNMTPPVIAPPVVTEEKKEEKEPEKPKTTVIPDEEFVSMLNDATEGKKDVQSFSQFLCDGPQTKVLTNGTDWETMGSFMQKIYGKKRFDIKSVEAVRDENNCVKILKIKYKKRTLGIF